MFALPADHVQYGCRRAFGGSSALLALRKHKYGGTDFAQLISDVVPAIICKFHLSTKFGTSQADMN